MKKLSLFVIHVLVLTNLAYASISDLLQQNTRSMPVQMDMLSENGITICTGDKKTVGCRDGANMAVTNAFWGRISDKVCPSDDGDPVTDCDASPDTLQKVKGYCEGKKECDLMAKHEKLQRNGTSHCPGVNKYLIVNYTCIPESRGVTLCQDVTTKLNCDAGWVMELADVFWGRRANNAATCGDEEGIECDNSDSASKYLKNKCNNKRSCHIKADPDVLSNKKSTPCSGKYLMVNYICRPPMASDTFDAKPVKEESKMQDASSKELMGLLEKHLTEIKEPKSAKVEPEKAALGMISQPKPASPVAPAMVPQSFPLGGTIAGHVRTIEKDNDEKPGKEEKPEAESESLSEKNSLLKKKTSEMESTSTEDDSTSVRSILSRAKDILKTLDMDTNNQARKRQFIAHPSISKAAPTKTAAMRKSIVASLPVYNAQQRAYLQYRQQQNRRYNVPAYQNIYPQNFRLRSWYGK